MLKIIENASDVRKAQKLLTSLLQRTWTRKQNRLIVWRPESRELSVSHNTHFWFASVPPEQHQITPKFWNSFGCYKDKGNLIISVEINIPLQTSKRISGYFACNPATNDIYLMHDGAIGGGRKGNGRAGFFDWLQPELVQAESSAGEIRLGLIVAPLKDNSTDRGISNFVSKVAQFKLHSKSNSVRRDRNPQLNHSYSNYFKEFSGKKRGERAKEFEYISRHGDIVDALEKWAEIDDDEAVVKNVYIDLGIKRGNQLTSLFEVKTNTNRQDLYTAIGQLIVHSGSFNNLQRYLVIPHEGNIPTDISSTLRILRIKLICFLIEGDKIKLAEIRNV